MFDIQKYKKQCYSIAKAFKTFVYGNGKEAEYEQYEAVVASANLLPKHVITKIEREVILKGKRFRPIDAYQF